MVKMLCRFLLKLWGFKVTGPNPEVVPKKVYAVYPHTSNWDFLLGILLKFAMPIDVNYIAKDSLFRWPHGILFRKLGGIPVDRSKNNNFVDTMANLYNKYDKLAFAISPEGTRKSVSKFKSGFYYIAVKAKVPIILVKFDFGNKVVDYSEPFYPTGVYADDLPFIINHFKGTKGKNPELACQWEDEFKQENK
ncbi:MAG: 1-acyl-sn-glycerol-3-phosphate acyltransferase [Saprospiraceae bacterium]|jgi:1-acyl-sn-glycerol-3-phosphate acyltransferase|nr:1-acyl-sn-glycerol-3-phosphate acyltransferase [Saprospiraceae bacterium]MBK7697772.1 1-acyl-sn-glycerol-3-phosphate acyltransferase [Saprospiraceae bacterium]MBK8827261.1 1-acyl-sn-glycerol-3-phosphate acyltransferase [Saprospiraceae bacterium]HQV97314.1 1-acyl-sn-glycerol-3-phosphate acyltransferase [Saprospiraceae bacterium]